MKITNVKPVQIAPIPWGWTNITVDGNTWVSKPLGRIDMPKLIDYFDWAEFTTEPIFELENDKPINCSTNMKSVFTTACRFLGTDEAMIQLIEGKLNLSPITKSMLVWNTALLWHSPIKIERFILGDEIGMNTGMMISPELYRNYILPQHRLFVDFAKLHGVDIWYHSDGDITAVLADIKQAGFAGVYYEDCGAMVDELQRNGLEGIEVVR